MLAPFKSITTLHNEYSLELTWQNMQGNTGKNASQCTVYPVYLMFPRLRHMWLSLAKSTPKDKKLAPHQPPPVPSQPQHSEMRCNTPPPATSLNIFMWEMNWKNVMQNESHAKINISEAQNGDRPCPCSIFVVSHGLTLRFCPFCRLCALRFTTGSTCWCFSSSMKEGNLWGPYLLTKKLGPKNVLAFLWRNQLGQKCGQNLWSPRDLSNFTMTFSTPTLGFRLPLPPTGFAASQRSQIVPGGRCTEAPAKQDPTRAPSAKEGGRTELQVVLYKTWNQRNEDCGTDVKDFGSCCANKLWSLEIPRKATHFVESHLTYHFINFFVPSQKQHETATHILVLKKS